MKKVDLKYGPNGETKKELLRKIKKHLGHTYYVFKNVRISNKIAHIKYVSEDDPKLYDFTTVDASEFEGEELFAIVTAEFEFTVRAPFMANITVSNICEFSSADNSTTIHTRATILKDKDDKNIYELYNTSTYYGNWVDLRTVNNYASGCAKSYFIDCLSQINNYWKE